MSEDGLTKPLVEYNRLWEECRRLYERGLMDDELIKWYAGKIKGAITRIRLLGVYLQDYSIELLADHLDGTDYIRRQASTKRRRNCDAFVPHPEGLWSAAKAGENGAAWYRYEKRKERERGHMIQLVSAFLAGGGARGAQEGS